MTLRRRLARLEAKCGRGGVEPPSVIFICDDTGEARSALVVGRGTVARAQGEGNADFMARAAGKASCAIMLPDNER